MPCVHLSGTSRMAKYSSAGVDLISLPSIFNLLILEVCAQHISTESNIFVQRSL